MITLKVIIRTLIYFIYVTQAYRYPMIICTLYMSCRMQKRFGKALDCSSYCAGVLPGLPFAFSFLPDSVHGLICYIQFLSKSNRGRLSALSLVSTSAAILKLLIQKAIIF